MDLYSTFVNIQYNPNSYNNMRNAIRFQMQKLKNFVHELTATKKLQSLQIKLISQKGSKVGSFSNKVQYPKNKYIGIECYLQTFYNSTSQNGRVNGQHLTLVTGAQHSGKTSLIKQSLQVFKKRKAMALLGDKKYKKQIQFTTLSSPQYLQELQRQTKFDNELNIVLEFDFDNNCMMKPEAFFNHIHNQIIKQLLRISAQVKAKKGATLLDAQIIKQIVIAQNSKEYAFMFSKDVIFAILSECDYITLSKQGLAKLEALNERIIQVSETTFFQASLGDKQTKQLRASKQEQKKEESSLYRQLIQILGEDKKISQLQASLLFFSSVFKRIQYEHRPESLLYRAHETGIQSTTFLFSILNYLCGFGNLNKSTLSKVLNEQPNTHGKYYISKGNHIDVVVAFMHLQKLSCYKHAKFIQWFDNILIQLHNSSNLRSHFPVVLELPDSYTLKQIQQMGRFQVDNPTVIEIPGYFKTNMHRYAVSMIMNQQAIKILFPVLGRNPSTWNEVILQLSNGVPLNDIVTSKAEVMNKRKLKFDSKINKIFIEASNLPYIDNNTLKYHLMQFFIIFKQCRGFMKTYYLHHNEQIYNNPIFVKFYENKIMYDHYYEMAVNFVDMRDLAYVNEQLNKVSMNQKIKFKIWRKFNQPYVYFMKELRYRHDLEVEYMKKSEWQTERSDYMNRQPYGRLNDYKLRLYDDVYKQKYNL